MTKDRLRLASAAAVLLASSCSVLYDLSPDQCGNNKECARFGSGFTCDEGICVDHSPKGGSGGGGTGGVSGSGDEAGEAGSGNDTGAGGSPTGGTDAGGTGGTPDVGGTGGTSGGGNEPECKTHNDCFVLNGEAEPWACVEGTCKPLLSEHCEVYLPFDDVEYSYLRDTDAIVIGAFSSIKNSTTGIQNNQMQNYDFALREIGQESGGIPGVKRRHVVAVTCEADYESQRELLEPIDHLLELKVPAIIAAFGSAADQQYVFENRTRDAGVFMMVPTPSDDTVVNLMDDGLIYHMLAGPHDLAVTYQPLLDLTITHLQNQGKLGTDPDFEDARLGLVINTDDRFSGDLGRDFETFVEWNGKSAGDNGDAGAFVSVSTRLGAAAVANEILALAPHVVVGATTAEMTLEIMPIIEERWDEETARRNQGKPFYILSPGNYGGPRGALLEAHPTVRERLLGISWPATLGTPAYEAYKDEYILRYGGKNYNSENYYDAVYFLVYGMVGAAPQIRGDTIPAGLARVTHPSGRALDVGGANVAEGFGFLTTNVNNKINLTGANGRPQWNTGGGRETPASVWCIEVGTTLYVPDALKYDTESGMLTGTFPSTCFTFPAP